MDDRTNTPLQGVVLCCTSIPPEQRSELAASAEQMGAIHKFDLTSDVTHLIVGDIDTPKYKFVARERLDIKCLLPSWVDAARESWMAGEDTDVAKLEEVHKLPTFHHLRICVTGFVDVDERKDLEARIIANGAEYKPNLTKDETHLIAKIPTGAKYEFAEKWGVKTVGIEWLDQSLQRGMSLDEGLYHPLLPVPDRGRGAWVQRPSILNSFAKRPRETDLGPNQPRKLRRTASAKLETQISGIWGDIAPEETKNENSHSTNLSRHDSSQGLLCNTAVKDSSDSLRRSKSMGDLTHGAESAKSALFDGFTFSIYGLSSSKTAVVQSHLRSRGAIVVDYTDLTVTSVDKAAVRTYLVVDHDIQPNDVPEFDSSLNITIVTELWLERCLHTKCFEEPSNRLLSQPFKHRLFPEFENLIVSRSGFWGVDLLHLSKAIKLVGAIYEESLSPTAGVLLCNGDNVDAEKLRCACSWGIPAVSDQWLWDCIRKDCKMPFGRYQIQPTRKAMEESLSETSKHDSRPLSVQPGHDRESRRSGQSDAPDRIKRQIEATKRSQKDQQRGTRPSTVRNNPFPDDTGPDMSISRSAREQSTLPQLPTPSSFTLNADSHQTQPSDIRSLHLPLREITPNSSPPKKTLDQKIAANTIQHEENDSASILAGTIQDINRSNQKAITHDQENRGTLNANDSIGYLGPTISSLLAQHHQRRVTTAQRQSNESSTDPKSGQVLTRRRRQLLGRAPSNTSSIHLSRASSVDTVNTDGLGTPLDTTNANRNAVHDDKNQSKSTNTAKSKHEPNPTNNVVYDLPHDSNPYASYNDTEESTMTVEPMQMTQIGYEDPDVRLWRDHVTKKMSAAAAAAVPVPDPATSTGTEIVRQDTSATPAPKAKITNSLTRSAAKKKIDNVLMKERISAVPKVGEEISRRTRGALR